ncbi:NAD(+) diphosphatase [Legionella oakridgensis]|uniref:NAD(+) diphosphatase n=1 Tax=Legionella oakridgensis TaxID=29423 RepID=UPI0003DE1E0E|nr:NAD(+) diphosphatase [Legionella oakridgensis]ETO92358.1 NTP pyrophosphohydrolase [Legionella oakridgensis RV-2-2007]
MIQTSQDKSCWLIIQNNDSVLLSKNNTLLNGNDIACLSAYFTRSFQLGILKDTEYFCAEIHAKQSAFNEFNAVSLRQALSLLTPDEYGMGVKAYSVINWDKNHQFCGRCGARTIHQNKHFERTCLSCRISFFPRISPSIIVLIHKGDQLVMARSSHFSAGIYGLIAGFVEAGESLENAVHREVKEEIGLEIKNLSYFGSQPWPFPDSLMLAFTAEYASGDLVIDKNEIEEAGWYRYDNLPGRPSMAISIASTLLDNFINVCQEKYKY